MARRVDLEVVGPLEPLAAEARVRLVAYGVKRKVRDPGFDIRGQKSGGMG